MGRQKSKAVSGKTRKTQEQEEDDDTLDEVVVDAKTGKNKKARRLKLPTVAAKKVRVHRTMFLYTGP